MNSHPALDKDVPDHYERGITEQDRLSQNAMGRLEWLGTREILARYLPPPPARRPNPAQCRIRPLTTLSGGERQRLKLAVHMAETVTTYVLDEPTSGLHLADVDRLLALLDRLVDGGNTVIVIEHHQAVMAHADWLIDLGPGAGHGGRVVFTGTPADLVARGDSLTARHLRIYVEGAKT